MRFYDLFNVTVEMTPRRTLWVCIAVALFFIAAAALYDASAMIDAPVRAWVGLR
jgi:preprotein translocase subunit Sec61beta